MGGFLRTTRLIAGLRLRRFTNQWQSLRRRRKPAGTEPRRTGTARKGGIGGGIGIAFLALIMALNPIHMTSRILDAARRQLGPVRDEHGRFEVRDRGFWRAVTAANAEDAPFTAEQVDAAFSREVARYPESRRDAWKRLLHATYAAQGAEGFVQKGADFDFLPRLVAWHSRTGSAILLRVAAALLALLCAAWFFLTLGSGNQDLGKVEWTFEWLFQFPVPAAHLFLAQILGCAVIDPLMWIGALPVLFTLFWSAGFGWWSLALGAAGALYLGVLIASLRVLTETLLRKRFAPASVKNFQALFTVAGTLGLFLLLANSGQNRLTDHLIGAAFALPAAIDWLPTALPAWACIERGGLAFSLASCAALGLAAPVAAAGFSAWLVRDGLVTGGIYAGRRRALAPSREGRPAVRGIVGKDVRLLLRDRNFLVQTLVVPALVIGFQLVVNSAMLDAVTHSFQHGAVLAFSVGGYVLVATALSVLSVEGHALWMLYTVPRSIERIMLEKTRLWACFALVYCAAVLGACAWANPALHAGDAVFALLALVGVGIYAFIAAGLGILATDPLEAEIRRRVRPEMVQLYMLIAAMYAYALYAPSAWARLGQIVLSALLAFALWQKVRDRAPFLLDPVAAPPSSISLADGLIAALAFFVLQGLTMLFATMAEAPVGLALVIAFVTAGAVTASFALYTFWRLKVPALGVAVGFRRAEGTGAAWPRALALGIGAGLAAAACGWLYLRAVAWFPALQKLKAESIPLPADLGWWIVPLAVIAAPLFEEFIFRGLVFRGLRRSAPAGVAILGSAAIFAIVHPPISFAPVFVMAVLAAWVFERTALLLAPIAVHVVYNGLMIAIAAAGL
jgi:membrane protease YdiL (CAAX protease family)